MKNLIKSYQNKKVFITGHSGFKGSWLYKILEMFGAKVEGYSLKEEFPNHFNLLGHYNKNFDMLDCFTLKDKIIKFEPDIIFHLAAQPLVLDSYKNPAYTFNINFNGTLELFEICKNTYHPKAIIIITTDKVYRNMYAPIAYREDDTLQGYDPYSTSKVCVENLVQCYRDSYFNNLGILSATCRAGNVLGGGDWGKNRLIPDIIRSINNNEKLKIRNPNAIRPWQHVLDCLTGYLLLGQKLLNNEIDYEGSWNFGPKKENIISVKHLIEDVKELWNEFEYEIETPNFHETQHLQLDSYKARNKLKWNSKYDISDIIKKTILWYMEYYKNANIITEKQIMEYYDE